MRLYARAGFLVLGLLIVLVPQYTPVLAPLIKPAGAFLPVLIQSGLALLCVFAAFKRLHSAGFEQEQRLVQRVIFENTLVPLQHQESLRSGSAPSSLRTAPLEPEASVHRTPSPSCCISGSSSERSSLHQRGRGSESGKFGNPR